MKCYSFKTLECEESVVANTLIPYLTGLVQYIFESKALQHTLKLWQHKQPSFQCHLFVTEQSVRLHDIYLSETAKLSTKMCLFY